MVQQFLSGLGASTESDSFRDSNEFGIQRNMEPELRTHRNSYGESDDGWVPLAAPATVIPSDIMSVPSMPSEESSIDRRLARSGSMTDRSLKPRGTSALNLSIIRRTVADVKTENAEGKGTFFDPVAMKEKVRQSMMKPKYNVADYYKEKGIWQAIAKSQNMDRLTLGVIGLNAMWIAVDTDLNTAEGGLVLKAHWVFQMAENGFCTFFTFEWLVRWMSFKRGRYALKDLWFLFDSCMVIMMVAETWFFSIIVLLQTQGGQSIRVDTSLMGVAKMLRLCRLFRMARLLRATPELMIMIKGLWAASRSVFFTLVLLAGLIFVYAIAFTLTMASTELGNAYFHNVLSSMYFFMVHGTLMLSADYKAFELHAKGGPLTLVFFFIFALFAAVLIMNMLIGVLCQVVSAVAATEKEEMLVTYVRGKLEKVMAIIDEDGGGTISRDEFMLILENLEAMEALQDVGVDVVGLVDFADFIFGADGEIEEDAPEVELTMPEFMEVVLQLRGSNNATVKDFVDLRKFVQLALQKTSTQIAATRGKLVELSNLVDSLHHEWSANAALDDEPMPQLVLCEKDVERPVCSRLSGIDVGLQTVPSEETLASLTWSVCLHGAWHTVEAPNMTCRMVACQAAWSAARRANGHDAQLSAVQRHVAEAPFLPETMDGLTGLRVAGFCEPPVSGKASVGSETVVHVDARTVVLQVVLEDDGILEGPVDGGRSDLSNEPSTEEVPPKADAPAIFEENSHFLSGGERVNRAFLPSTSAGPISTSPCMQELVSWTRL